AALAADYAASLRGRGMRRIDVLDSREADRSGFSAAWRVFNDRHFDRAADVDHGDVERAGFADGVFADLLLDALAGESAAGVGAGDGIFRGLGRRLPAAGSDLLCRAGGSGDFAAAARLELERAIGNDRADYSWRSAVSHFATGDESQHH